MSEQILPIVLDIETSGLDLDKCGIISIGAVCLDNIDDFFYEEARLDEDDIFYEEAAIVNGFSETEMRDKSKQSQEELVRNFLEWVDKKECKILAGHNVGFFDINFIKKKIIQYGLQFKTRYRSFDLCSVAQLRYFQVHNKFLLDELGENAMNLSNVLEFCGIKDERVKVEPKKGVIKEGKPHNALEDARLTAECFYRLMFGKNLFPEFEKFEVPEVLKK